VISQYKELELQKSKLPTEVESIFNDLRSKILESQKASENPSIGNFLEPHVIDLSKSGHIGMIYRFTIVLYDKIYHNHYL